MDMDKTYSTEIEDDAAIVSKEVLDTIERVKKCLIDIYTAANVSDAEIKINMRPHCITVCVTENKHY